MSVNLPCSNGRLRFNVIARNNSIFIVIILYPTSFLLSEGYKVGCVSEERYAKMASIRQRLKDNLALLTDYKLNANIWAKVTGVAYSRPQKNALKT